MKIEFDYTTVISGRITIEIPDDTPMPELEAYRQARASQPFLRNALLDIVRDEQKGATDDNPRTAPTA